MNDKKQIEKQAIEEMANTLWHLPMDLHLNCYNDCVELSKILNEEKYRKQSEVIDEFAKRLLDAFPEPKRGGNLCPAIYYDDYRYIIEELAEEMKGGAE